MRQNEEWVSAAFDSFGDAIFACDKAGRILLVNQVAASLTGRNQEHIARQRLGEVLRIRDAESGRGIEDLVKAAMLSRDEVRSADRQYILISEHGTKTPIEFTISPIFDDSGRLLGAVLSVRDVTESNHFQEVLIRAKKEWERSMDSISLLVALVDKQRRIMRLNQAMASSLGVKPREAIGMSLSEIFRTAEMPEGECPHANCMADHKEHSAVFFSSKLGSKVVMTAAPYYDVSGQLIGSVHVVQPIAEPEGLQKADRPIGNRPSQLGEVLGSFFAEQTKDVTSARIELKRCSEKLETTSEALRILIQAVEGNQRDLASRAVSDLMVRVRPFLAQLRAQKLPKRSTELVLALDNILSSHHLHLSHEFSKISLLLTPHEIEVCVLIHSGAGSKQIAEILGVTVDAVSKQRTRIRKKLGLNHSGQSLASWLRGGSEKDSSDKGLSPASVLENTYDEKNSEPQ
jgi:PAS domain S-box-containing protein